MYTYAFLPNSDDPLDLPEGISGSLQLVAVNGIAALVEPDLSLETIQISDDVLMQAVLCHDQVIREMFEQTPLLPLRFGTYFVSRQGLMEHLGAHWTEYLDKLAKLQGQAEYLLKLVPLAAPEFAVPPDLKGKDYFLFKKQDYQTKVDWQRQQRSELEKVLEAMAQRCPQWTCTEPKDGVERIYILSDRQYEPLLQDWVKTWQSFCPRWELSLGEALPPYHFV
jgi:hypothetical protein